MPSLRRPGFEDEDDDEYENEVPHENARKRSWKRTWAASAADMTKAANSSGRTVADRLGPIARGIAQLILKKLQYVLQPITQERHQGR